MSIIRILLAAIMLFAGIGGALAQEPLKIRLGTLFPRGTSAHHILLEMGEKWRAVQGADAAFVVYTGRKIAELWGTSEEDVARTTEANADRLFSL